MEPIDDILREMREFADTDSQTIGRDVLRRKIQHFADSIEAAHNREREATREKSSRVGNAVVMREALKYLRDASREFCHLIVNSKYNEVYDKYKYSEVAKIRDAIANANAALSAPARNCDLPEVAGGQPIYLTEQAWRVFKRSHKDAYPDSYGLLRFVDWLFAISKGEVK